MYCKALLINAVQFAQECSDKAEVAKKKKYIHRLICKTESEMLFLNILVSTVICIVWIALEFGDVLCYFNLKDL